MPLTIITSICFIMLLAASGYGAINPIEIDGRHFFDSVTKEPVSLKCKLYEQLFFVSKKTSMVIKKRLEH